MDIDYFKYFHKEDLQEYLSPRDGETKIGEKLSFGPFEDVKNKFVVLGIQESIGVKGNLGIAGTDSAWPAFISKFLNVQHTGKLKGEDIHILGAFNFQSLYASCEDLNDYREATERVDATVFPLIQLIIEKGAIPIVIGGSHANAYPLIKGASKAKKGGIAAINLDAHADFRALEGRHSGNPFSYAFSEGFLNRYHMIGLHENYNSQNMLDQMMGQGDKIGFISWEDIFLRKKISYTDAISQAISKLKKVYTGVELDLDVIENILSSAQGPSGFNVTQARQYTYQCANNLNTAYFHICEGASKLENGLQSNLTGKLISYLVTDFIKGSIEK